MTAELSEAVAQYIGQENARYAYQVNGPWGSGKTHWWHAEGIPLIEQRYPDAVLIYASLHGASEIHQLGMQIISQLLPVASEVQLGLQRLAADL